MISHVSQSELEILYISTNVTISILNQKDNDTLVSTTACGTRWQFFRNSCKMQCVCGMTNLYLATCSNMFLGCKSLCYMGILASIGRILLKIHTSHSPH